MDLLKEEFPQLPIMEKLEEVVDREEEEDFVAQIIVHAVVHFHHMNDENDFAEEPLVDDDNEVAEELVVEEEDRDGDSSNSS